MTKESDAFTEGEIFILLSIKTRIETLLLLIRHSLLLWIFILLSIKTRIETANEMHRKNVEYDFYPTIH